MQLLMLGMLVPLAIMRAFFAFCVGQAPCTQFAPRQHTSGRQPPGSAERGPRAWAAYGAVKVLAAGLGRRCVGKAVALAAWAAYDGIQASSRWQDTGARSATRGVHARGLLGTPIRTLFRASPPGQETTQHREACGRKQAANKQLATFTLSYAFITVIISQRAATVSSWVQIPQMLIQWLRLPLIRENLERKTGRASGNPLLSVALKR